MAVSGGGDMLASGTSLPHQRQQQQQQLPQGLSEPSASSSSAQVRDLQHRISVLESQLQASGGRVVEGGRGYEQSRWGLAMCLGCGSEDISLN